MRLHLLPIAFILSITGLRGAEPAAPAAEIQSSELGITFTPPPGFTMQKREQKDAKKRKPLSGIYLVKTDKAQCISPTHRPIFLWLIACDKSATTLLTTFPKNSKSQKEITERKIGGRVVTILPGLPILRDPLFAYLVPRGDGSFFIALIAPRYLTEAREASEDGPPSGMDKVIENVITSLKFTPGWRPAASPAPAATESEKDQAQHISLRQSFEGCLSEASDDWSEYRPAFTRANPSRGPI
jgi:hypothetical protein